MSTTLHFPDLKKQQNFICLVNIRMSVPFRIATFVRFNHFIPHCFVLFCFVCREYCPEYYRIIYLNGLLTNGSLFSKPL